MFPQIFDGAEHLVDFIKSEISLNQSKSFIARDIMKKYTCDVVAACLFGTDVNAFQSDSAPMLVNGKKFLRDLMDSLISVWPQKAVTDEVASFFMKTMKEAIKERHDNKQNVNDMLAQMVLMQKVKGMSDDDVLAHCLTLFLDAFETTAITLENALFYLGRNEKVQQKLREELSEDLNFENINKFVFLDQVFYETLRLHPALTFTTRVSTEEIEIKENSELKFVIKKNSAIWIPIHSIQRDSGKATGITKLGCVIPESESKFNQI